jgi:hypothetical protein
MFFQKISIFFRFSQNYGLFTRANLPAMSDGKSHSFGYGVMTDFNVSIPSCTGKLGRLEERAEVWKSWMACALRHARGWQP